MLRTSGTCAAYRNSMSEVEILPAILPQNFDELERGLAHLRGVAPVVQIDLVGTNVLLGHAALPQWEEFDFECDIMLPDPAREVQRCIDIGASRIVVHASAGSAREALDMLQPLRGGDLPLGVGVALAARDAPEALVPFAGLYDYVQVMGIVHIGRQGEPPAEEAVALVQALRAAYPELVIQVDGAVAPRAREFAEAGANRLVVGSALINAPDPRAVYKELYTLANALR